MSTPEPYMWDSGQGSALLLLHAFPLDASQWDEQVAQLSDRYRCIRPDWYGCGRSPAPPDGVSLDDYAESVVRGLERRGVDRFSVAGLSMGGYIAFAILRRAPGRVTSLVLASTKATADSEAGRRDRLAMAAGVLADGVELIVEPTVARLLSERAQRPPEVSNAVRARIRGCTAGGVAAAQFAMAARPDSTSLLASIAIPTLVVGGDADPVTTPADLDIIAAGIPGSRRVHVPQAGHLVNLEEPARFNGELEAFFA